MTTDQAHTIILLLIFICLMQIFVLLRVTQTYWALLPPRRVGFKRSPANSDVDHAASPDKK